MISGRRFSAMLAIASIFLIGVIFVFNNGYNVGKDIALRESSSAEDLQGR